MAKKKYDDELVHGLSLQFDVPLSVAYAMLELRDAIAREGMAGTKVVVVGDVFAVDHVGVRELH